MPNGKYVVYIQCFLSFKGPTEISLFYAEKMEKCYFSCDSFKGPIKRNTAEIFN